MPFELSTKTPLDKSFSPTPLTDLLYRMPVPETMPRIDNRPSLGHVNLMVDSLIANATVDDLRAIIRSVLASGSPELARSFTTAARTHLRQHNAKSLPSINSLFAIRPSDGTSVPTQHLHNALVRARSFYGAGMGFASLSVLAGVVRATIGLQWTDDGDMADALAVVDADISQAIQSSKEELEDGRVADFSLAHSVYRDLQLAVTNSVEDVRLWGGEYPFERAVSSVEYWKF